MVLNEVAIVEQIIENGVVGDNAAEDVVLLVKYYCQIYKSSKGRLQRTRIVERVLSFLNGVIKDYEINDWRTRISKYINKFGHTPLHHIEYVPVTLQELNTIRDLRNKKLEKIAFVSLVYCKLFNLRNTKNNNFVNVDYNTVFTSARVSASVYEQPMLLHELKEQGLLERSKRFRKTNYKVLFVNDTDEVALKVSDLRELGYQYLRWRGDKTDQFVECAECGILIRKKNGATKYCPDCRGYQPIKIKTLTCVDCGEEFVVNSKSNHSCRCDECYKKYRKNYKNQKEKERYRRINF